jgi:glutamyl-tRNA reductase
MLQNFCIIHRRKPRIFDGGEAPVWSTCLRSLAFVKSPAAVVTEAQDATYVGARAYAFLLEVVCGLHSPIVGETEVFGQFKIFVDEWLKAQPECSGLAQKVLADAKALRSKHLRKIGNQSYGSWLRKNVKAKEVHLLGGGQLVREVLPYLNKQGKIVSVHVRDPRKVDFHTGSVKAIPECGFVSGALVIAAPMTAVEIESWLGDKEPSQIFDLRDNSCADPLKRAGEHHGLRAIFNQIQESKAKLQPVIEKVRADIAVCAEKISAQALVRPQGWDDLCA